jgi:hypothetical protein
MPVPLLAYAVAVGAGMATGYVIDHLVGDGRYTKEEAVLDATLGLVGGSVVKPVLRIGGRAKTSLRISRGSPSLTQRAVGFKRDPVMWGSKLDQGAYIAIRTGKQSGRDAKRIVKFFGVSGAHSYYLAARGTGPPSRPSPTGPTRSKGDFSKYHQHKRQEQPT